MTVRLSVKPKWWFAPAFYLVMFLLWAGIIRDKRSAEHWDGKVSASERVSKWLADFAFRYEAR